MAQNKGQRIATDAVAMEIGRREWSKQDFADASGLDWGTVNDLLNYNRSAQSKTQAIIEKTFRWVPGTYRKLSLGVIDEPEYLADEGTVIGGSQTEDVPAWNTRKPEGMTDEEHKRIVREAEDYYRWKIQQASQER